MQVRAKALKAWGRESATPKREARDQGAARGARIGSADRWPVPCLTLPSSRALIGRAGNDRAPRSPPGGPRSTGRSHASGRRGRENAGVRLEPRPSLAVSRWRISAKSRCCDGEEERQEGQGQGRQGAEGRCRREAAEEPARIRRDDLLARYL